MSCPDTGSKILKTEPKKTSNVKARNAVWLSSDERRIHSGHGGLAFL
jgi:hypothetical protein